MSIKVSSTVIIDDSKNANLANLIVKSNLAYVSPNAANTITLPC